MTRVLYSVASIIVVFLVLVHVLLYFMQERMIFFPQPLDADIVKAVRRSVPHAQPVVLKREGQQLQGWFVPGGAATLIYFGGNAEEVTGFALESDELHGVSFALFNYRGYGESTGAP